MADPERDEIEERLADRLTELRRELEVGERRLAGLTTEAEALQQTMLRISGAI